VVSELPWASKVDNCGNNFVKSPYFEYAYTGAGSTSARSRKSIIMEDSFTFTVDDDNKLNLLGLFQEK
jgi:hypothetical protein